MGKKRFWKKLSAVFLAVTVGAVGAPRQVSGAGEAVEILRETVDEEKEITLLQQIEKQYENVDLSEAAEERFGTAALIVGCCLAEDMKLQEPEGGKQKADKVISLGEGVFALFYPNAECAQDAWMEYQNMEGILFAEPDAVVESEERAEGVSVDEVEEKPEILQILENTEEPEVLQISENTEEPEVLQISENMEELEDMKTTEQLLEDKSDVRDTVPEEERKSAVITAVIDTGVDLKNTAIAEYLVDKESIEGGGEETVDIVDENGHGTKVTGLLTDAFRQAGLSRTQVGILPVKVADEDGRCTVLQLYLGIKSAMEQGADILNISMGTKNLAESFLLEQAMQEAYAAGIIVVTSAGNDSADVADFAPANCSSVITVGSVNQKKKKSVFSNCGHTLDCVSYGEDIRVTGLSEEETQEDGTSYAAAFVTAELAVQMEAGTVLSPDAADAYVKSRAEDLGTVGWDEIYGYGLIGNYSYPEVPGADTEEETEKPDAPEDSEGSEDAPVLSTAYLQRVNTYNLLVGDIEILSSNENIESTRLLAGIMKKSIEDMFSDETDMETALNGELKDYGIYCRTYVGTGNEVVDSAAQELVDYLKEGVLAFSEQEMYRQNFEKKLEEFVELLSGYQDSVPLEKDVYIEASTTKTVSDAATLQSIAQTAGDYTVKLTRGITLTSEIVVTNGCTLRLQSNAKSMRRIIKFGTLPSSYWTLPMSMFKVDGTSDNKLYIGTENGDYPITLDGNKQQHNGFLIYNSVWTAVGKDQNIFRSETRIYPGTILQNNLMYFDAGCQNGASGSAICNYGTLRMYGGTIRDNGFTGENGQKVGEGGGIANYQKFYMTGGEISGNVATNGNGILTGRLTDAKYLGKGFVFEITGGSIHDNGNPDEMKYTSNGGGILINPNTPVSIGGSSIDDVKIYGNMADYGGGIANYGTCNLGKCRIYQNYSQSEGGGILNRARVNTAAVPVLNIAGAYVYQNYCSKTNSSYAGGIASLKRTVSGKDIVPQITISSGYFYDNDGFSIHIDSGTLSFGAGARFGFSSYTNASNYKVTEEWYGSGVCNTGGTVNVTGTARMFVPVGAIGIKNTGTLNIGDGADFEIFCQDADCAISNTGKLTCGKLVKNSSGTILYPYTIDGSASRGIENTGSGTAYLIGRIRGNYKVGNTAKSADTSADNRKITTGIYNSSAASYSTANPYAVILQGTMVDGKAYTGYVGYAETGILNSAASGSISIKQGEVSSCSGNGVSNKGNAYIQDADAKLHDNGKDGVYNYKGASLTVSSAGAVSNNGDRGIYNGGTANISAGAKVYGNKGNGITNGEDGTLTVSGAADIYGNGGNGIHNRKNMTISGDARIHNNTGYGLANSGTTVLSGNTDIYGNGKAGISNGAGYKLTMSKGTVRENAAGGVLNNGTFAFKGGSITKNAGTAGAGVSNKAGAVFTMSGGSINGNSGTGSGIYNEASGTVNLNGGLLYGNSGYGVQNLGTCNISGIKVGFGSFTSNAAYATSGNASGGIHNSGTLHLVNGGYINGGNAPAVVNTGTMHADAGAASILMSVSGDTVLSNAGKLDTAYAAGKTSLWVLGGSCKYGIKNTGSMKFSGKADGRYKVTANGYSYLDSSRGFTEAAIYNNSTNKFDSSYPYAAYIYGDAYLIGSAKDGLRTDKGTCRMDAVYTALNKNGVNVGSSAAVQLSNADARIYANETGINNNGTVNMTNANIYSNTKHGVYQNGTFYMSGAAKVNVNNDVCLPVGHVITVNGALTTNGVVAKVTPLKKTGAALEKITEKKTEEKFEIGRAVVKTSYAGSKGSNALFYQTTGYRFTLSNGGILRPGDYMDREVFAEEKHTEISDKDIVISNKYTVAYEKNIDEKDENGNPVDVAVNDMPVNQDKFWCENLQLPNKEGTYTKPSVSTEPYASYYRFLNWNDKADGTGNVVILPAVYKENEATTIYALWQKNFNVAYIGNEQSAGDDFTEYDIAQDSMYTFDDNQDLDGTEHFTKDIENSYIDEETGEEVKQETTATVAQWSLEKESPIEEQNYDRKSEVSASALYTRAEEMNKQKEGVITNGAPNSDYGLFPQLNQLQPNTVNEYRGNSPFAMSGSNTVSMNLFAALPAGQPFINLYAVWDKGPVIEAYDLYYTLEEAQSTTDTEGITMEELLSRAEATDEEDGILSHGKDVSFGEGKKTTFIVSDYASSDFSSFTAEGSVTINYQAVDSIGNITNKMVTVHIVDTSAEKVDKGKVRFISEKYMDTLSEDSIWKVDSEYYNELAAVLANHRENAETFTGRALGKTVTLEKPGTGTWVTAPEQVWVFTHEEVEAVKDYVESNGIGNSKNAAALDGFLAQFAACRQ